MSPKFLIVGNPENRRITLFQAALHRLGYPAGRVLSYADLLAKNVSLEAELQPHTVLRIESPGENFEVERGLLREGIADAEREGVPTLSAHQISRLTFDRGRILCPRQSYLGYRKVLRQIANMIALVPGVPVMNTPGDIEVMFDKRLSHARCQLHRVPVPASLGTVNGYEELIANMEAADVQKVFFKLANGSSASGVVAFLRKKDHAVAMTSVEMVREKNRLKLYNSLKVRCYTRTEDHRDLIDALCQDGVHAEHWLPKAILDQQGNFDLRVLVIQGEARHWVIRQSRGPLTNLHLGNRRGNREQFLNRVGPKQWKSFQETCCQVMQAFPNSLHGGVDLLVLPDLVDHAVLEVNAFGDLLPGILSQGVDSYEAEIQAVLTQFPRD